MKRKPIINGIWEDHYQVLQVHFMAEPEIIKSAYLRLSRKYHPDVNPAGNAEEKMKAINHAYEILSNPESRKQYMIRWLENYSAFTAAEKDSPTPHPMDSTVEPAKQVLLAYLEHLSNKCYEAAFALISEHDKRQIAMADYTQWQTLVSEVFELTGFECALQKVYPEPSLNGSAFEMAAGFTVRVHENNHVMGRAEEDQFHKNVVLESGQWRVFLGYKDLGAVISRFKALAELKKARPLHRITLKKSAATASVLGAIQRQTFYEKARSEQMRFNRYGNCFSLIFCTLDVADYPPGYREAVMKEAGATIAGKIRGLDSCCRWRENTFAVLLPETNQGAALKVASKIRRALEEGMADILMEFVIAEQRYSSLQALFRRLQPRD